MWKMYCSMIHVYSAISINITRLILIIDHADMPIYM